MADTMVPVKKSTAPSTAMEPFHAFRTETEMDRLFDRFFTGFSWPMMRRPLWREPAWDFETTFEMAAPKVDVTEDDKAYMLTAELPGLTEKEIELSVADGMLTLRREGVLAHWRAGSGASAPDFVVRAALRSAKRTPWSHDRPKRAASPGDFELGLGQFERSPRSFTSRRAGRIPTPIAATADRKHPAGLRPRT
jgi:hypothetical protein